MNVWFLPVFSYLFAHFLWIRLCGVYVLSLEANAFKFSFILRIQMYGSNWLLDLFTGLFHTHQIQHIKRKPENFLEELKSFSVFPYFSLALLSSTFFPMWETESTLSSALHLHSPCPVDLQVLLNTFYSSKYIPHSFLHLLSYLRTLIFLPVLLQLIAFVFCWSLFPSPTYNSPQCFCSCDASNTKVGLYYPPV